MGNTPLRPDPADAGVVIVDIAIAMDGNRDGVIDFDNPNDAAYLFWVNDDHDERHYLQTELTWVEDDLEGSPDCDNDYIGFKSGLGSACKRDLEDFTRLHIRISEEAVALPKITYHLKFENGSDNPSANIFEAVNEYLTYLSDVDAADAQIKKTRLLTIDATERELPRQFIKSGNQVSPFILEGKHKGTGNLVLIVKEDRREVCKKVVTLDLRPITAFYEKYVVTASVGDYVNTTDGGNANPTTYTPDTDAYLLYVHGWKMTDQEKDRWAETVFKRLWWQHYKGHVGAFQWPTYTGGLTYDASEIRAWRSGQALNDRIEKLNSTHLGKVRVFAHSMGNVVMGEALRMFSSPVVHTYIAAQAAIPAHCYDGTISNYWTGFSTPNIYARYSSGASSSAPYLAANSTRAEAMVLYFNARDYALGWWEINNEMKPDINYWYTDGDSNIDSYAPESGDRFYFDSPLPYDERTMIIPRDRFEVFARIAESRSRALGRVSSVGGFGRTRNLQNWDYDNTHYSHSREFRSNIASEWPFWSVFFGDAGFVP